MRSCGDIAKVERRRNRQCTAVYKEKCPGLCKSRCDCVNYEYEFKAKKTSENWVRCEDLGTDKCKHLLVAKNCPTLCNDECKAE